MNASKDRLAFQINSDGFSLISVMVAVAIIGILMASVMQLTKMISTQARYAANVDDLNNISKQLTSLLTISSNCANLYGGETIDRTNLGDTATPQLNVVSKKPFAAADPMDKINSGRIKLLSLGLTLKHKLAGSGPAWYQGDAYFRADDPNDLGNFNARRVPMNFQLDASDKIVTCGASGMSVVSSASTAVTSVPYGKCGPGQVMVGFDAKGVICAGGGSPVTTGTGCTGDNCNALDGGPCYGDNCKTNGDYCEGDNCKATGTCATCSGLPTTHCQGDNCCAGPGC